MGDMNHFPPAWKKTRNIQHNGDRSPVWTFHICSPWKFVSADNLVTPSIGIKPNFITVPHLSGSWLNIIEVRRDVHFFRKIVVFSVIPWVIKFLVYFVGLLMFWHACNKHISITLFFVINILMHEIDLLNNYPGNTGINFICPLVSEAWNFYHTCLGF